ncbi:beta-lactamase family protein [Cladophialophora carrionii]|uniref:Beta-lactamase family protein n=1 Tax=Cladophialophora carrionii TaxID=86049 RepID=A0A1C1D1E4_9EURO|nr:beta-lactamase family protein [Cladophialophora carrionii]
MPSTRATIILAFAFATRILCDYLGPTYPAPTDLATDGSHVSAAWRNLSSTLNGYIANPSANLTSPAGLKNVTFSVGMFSIHDPSAAALQFHHASAEIANSSDGLRKVDGDSIYRVASITKLITTFAGMLNLKASDWDRPITEFVPTLAAYAAAHPAKDDRTGTVDWSKVTLAALASQIAGTPRDVSPFDPSDYLLADLTGALAASFGLPPLDPSDPVAVPPCLVSLLSGNMSCPSDEYAIGAEARPPLFLPWTSPAYTDYGFMLLGAAISNITGKSIHDVYSQSIFDPLGMDSTDSNVPDPSQYGRYVIPGNASVAGLTPEGAPQVAIPSGGIFSTTNDLAKLGTAILNSTLLDSDLTRQWMKPVSHTAMFEYSVGAPWEIYRYTHPRTGLVTDLYTKLGDSGYYSGYLVLIPDYDAGFSIIMASSLRQRTALVSLLADAVTEAVLPGLSSQAEAEAGQSFVGTYISQDDALNTTLTLAIDPTGMPGLVMTQFTSNGTDVLQSEAMGAGPIRLLHSITDRPNGRVAFRASHTPSPSGGLFSRGLNTNSDWLGGDSPTYAGIGLGLFVFDVDSNGNATGVSPEAWRVKLVKGS